MSSKTWFYKVMLRCLILTVLFVDAVKKFNITCDCHDKFEIAQECQGESLPSVIALIQDQVDRDINIDINIPSLRLNRTVRFQKLNSLTINSKLGSTTIICISHDVGIVLSEIRNKIQLNNLNISFCGSIVNTEQTVDTDNDKVYSSALTILQSGSVELNRVVIERSVGLGMMILERRGGSHMNVVSSIFKDNKLPVNHSVEAPEQLFGGGGVYIELFPSSEGSHNNTMMLVFESCQFLGNSAHIDRSNCQRTAHSDVLGDAQRRNEQGGGAYVLIKSDAVNIYLSFINCNFADNKAFIGGGLSVIIEGGNVNNIKVDIKDSHFKNNGCENKYYTKDSDCDVHTHTGFGGGIQLAFSSSKQMNDIVSHSRYLIRNVSFINNCAEVGGGVSYFSYRGTANTNSILFDGCTFKENIAHIGSAVAMTPNRFSKISSGDTVSPMFINCLFLANLVFNKCFPSLKAQRRAGIGTVYVSSYNVDFQGSNCFENNWGSAVYTFNGILNFTRSDMYFINNTGHQGGALSLVGSSTIIVGPNNYEFINNTALTQGGAIHVSLSDNTDFTVSRSCFIRYFDDTKRFSAGEWTANITFSGNRALYNSAGHSLYVTSLLSCQTTYTFSGWAEESLEHALKLFNFSRVFVTRGIKFDNDQALQPQIATDGAWLDVIKQMPLKIIPGETYNHSVMVVDDLGQKIDTSFTVNIHKKLKAVGLDSSYSTVVRNEIKLMGKANESARLYMQPVSPRNNFAKIDVKLLPCPPGFKLDGKLECVCNAYAHFGLLSAILAASVAICYQAFGLDSIIRRNC